MKKYRACKVFSLIKTFEISKETSKTVILTNGKRESKVTEWYAYFDTWKQAKEWLMAKAFSEVISARLHLERMNSRYGNVKGLKNPDKDK